MSASGVATIPSGAPGSVTSPSSTKIRLRTPSSRASISAVVFSDSISAMVAPSLIVSPTETVHALSVPESISSPNLGILTT